MIFLLLLVGSILIFLNVRALRKEKDSFQFTLNNAGNDMEEFEVQIGALRREFTETILELQIEIEKLNNLKHRIIARLVVRDLRKNLGNEYRALFDMGKFSYIGYINGYAELPNVAARIIIGCLKYNCNNSIEYNSLDYINKLNEILKRLNNK